MGWKKQVKFVAEVIWLTTSVLFIAGCSHESIEPVRGIEPQYSRTDIYAPADACSGQVTPPAKPESASKQESAAAVPSKPASEAATSSTTQLDRRTELSGMTAGTPFGRAIEAMRNSTSPPINIVVLWNDLRDKAGIDQQTPLGVDILPGVSLRKNLEIVLASLSTRQVKIDYTTIDGVVVIATKNSLPKKMPVRSYDVTDLSSRPAD